MLCSALEIFLVICQLLRPRFQQVPSLLKPHFERLSTLTGDNPPWRQLPGDTPYRKYPGDNPDPCVLGSGIWVSVSLQIIHRPVGRLGLGLESEPPRRGSVRVRTPSRGGGYFRGIFGRWVVSGGELSPGGLCPGIPLKYSWSAAFLQVRARIRQHAVYIAMSCTRRLLVIQKFLVASCQSYQSVSVPPTVM